MEANKSQKKQVKEDPFRILPGPKAEERVSKAQILSALKKASKISMSSHDLQKILKNWGFIQVLAKAPNQAVREILLDSCSDAAAETLRVAVQHGLSPSIKETNLGQRLRKEITGGERDHIKKVLSMRVSKKPISKRQQLSMRRHMKQSGTGLISILTGLIPMIANAFTSLFSRK